MIFKWQVRFFSSFFLQKKSFEDTCTPINLLYLVFFLFLLLSSLKSKIHEWMYEWMNTTQRVLSFSICMQNRTMRQTAFIWRSSREQYVYLKSMTINCVYCCCVQYILVRSIYMQNHAVCVCVCVCLCHTVHVHGIRKRRNIFFAFFYFFLEYCKYLSKLHIKTKHLI